MNHQKFVSVVIATFMGKTKGYLAETIQSVLSQTFSNLELIIIDDGSTDGTYEFIKEQFDDNRIVCTHIQNCGVSQARNIGIMQSKGDFVCILDDDDVWTPKKLEIQLARFQSDDELGMIYCAIERIDSDGNYISMQYHESSNDFYQKMLSANLVDATSGVIIKKDVLNQVGLFANIVQGYEDYELWVRIAKDFKIGSIKEPLVKYRVHPQNISQNMQKSSQSLFDALDLICKNDPAIDKNKLYFDAILNLANKSFEIEHYQFFRNFVRQLTQFDNISLALKLKFVLSYFPSLIKFLRKIK